MPWLAYRWKYLWKGIKGCVRGPSSPSPQLRGEWVCVRLCVTVHCLARTGTGGQEAPGLRLITVTCRRRLRIQSKPSRDKGGSGMWGGTTGKCTKNRMVLGLRLGLGIRMNGGWTGGQWPAVNSINYNNQRHVSCGSGTVRWRRRSLTNYPMLMTPPPWPARLPV